MTTATAERTEDRRAVGNTHDDLFAMLPYLSACLSVLQGFRGVGEEGSRAFLVPREDACTVSTYGYEPVLTARDVLTKEVLELRGHVAKARLLPPYAEWAREVVSRAWTVSQSVAMQAECLNSGEEEHLGFSMLAAWAVMDRIVEEWGDRYAEVDRLLEKADDG
jgi:hypothetical protein